MDWETSRMATSTSLALASSPPNKARANDRRRHLQDGSKLRAVQIRPRAPGLACAMDPDEDEDANLDKSASAGRMGKAVEYLVAAACILSTRGELNVSTSMVDDEGVDLVFHRRDSSATLAVQVKARMSDMQARSVGRFRRVRQVADVAGKGGPRHALRGRRHRARRGHEGVARAERGVRGCRRSAE